MKKYAYILTFFYGVNYGSKLQATALGKELEQKGYEVTFIKTFLDFQYLLKHPSLFFTRILNFFNRKKMLEFFAPESYTISEERQKRTEEYNAENLRYITIKSHSQWKEILARNPVFITGSDIVWQPAMGYPEKYFLDFVYYTKCKRISYAASIGAKALPKKYIKYYKKYLGSYDAISMRENASKALFAPIIDNEITKVIDPTLLVSRDVWDQLSDKAEIPNGVKEGAYILCYFVMKDERYWKYVELAAKQTGMQVVVLPMHKQDEEQSGYAVITNGTPYEFVWLIKNAAFVITDSFHASVFSFLYEKEIYILRRTRQDEDEKYNDLLSRYHMRDRLVENEDAFIRKQKIDYALGKNVLEQDREQAREFLRDALSQR